RRAREHDLVDLHLHEAARKRRIGAASREDLLGHRAGGIPSSCSHDGYSSLRELSGITGEASPSPAGGGAVNGGRGGGQGEVAQAIRPPSRSRTRSRSRSWGTCTATGTGAERALRSGAASDLGAPETCAGVVVHHPDGLHPGVHDRRADELEAAPL